MFSDPPHYLQSLYNEAKVAHKPNLFNQSVPILKKKEGKMIPLTLKLNILASSKFWYKSSYFSVLHKSLIKEIEMTCFYVYPIKGMLREFCSSEVLHEANLDL